MRADTNNQAVSLSKRRLAALRQIAPDLHASLAPVLQSLRAQSEAEPGAELDRNTAALVGLVAQVATEAPQAALVLIKRLPSIDYALTDPAALRKWALHGLQRYRGDDTGQLHFFEWEDPLVFSDHRTEHDSAYLISQRNTLSLYLAGFGFAEHELTLHDPKDTRQAPPSITIGEQVIQFPRRYPGIEPHQRAPFLRAAIAHAAAHLSFSAVARPAGNRLRMLLAVMELIEDARVERLMIQKFPGLGGLWGSFHVANRVSAGFQFAGLAARLSHALHDPAYEDKNPWVIKGRLLFDKIASEDIHDQAKFDTVSRILAIDIEKMRLSVPPDYRAQPLYRDDNSLLWNYNEPLPQDITREVALEDFELRDQQDIPPETPHADVDLRRRTRHPEWDHHLDAVREDWTTVIEALPRHESVRSSSSRMRYRQNIHGLQRTPDRAIRRRRMIEGDELDLNSVIDNVIDRRARLPQDGRIFQRHGRRRRATAIVLLMDLSESTRRFVPGSFDTVLEIEKRAATVVAQSLDTKIDRVALHGFASNGRHEVHYQCIKDFDEPFGSDQRDRLSKLDGGLSTRMGAALRHASAALAAERSDHKVILMLTDGEPSDIDAIDDDYLVEDAHHAVVSAGSIGIRTFCLTLDRYADSYVRRIFGSRNYMIADRADGFAGYAGQALVRLVAH